MAEFQLLSDDEVKRLWKLALLDDTPVSAFAASVQRRFIDFNGLALGVPLGDTNSTPVVPGGDAKK